MSTKQSRDPLLYIMQPTIKFPKANMQERFVVSRTVEEQKELPLLNEQAKEKFDSQVEDSVPPSDNIHNKGVGEKVDEVKTSNKKSVSQRKKLGAEEVQEIIGQYHQEQSLQEEEPKTQDHPKRNHPSHSFKRVKGFKEMLIPEKLNYLANFPKQLPPVPCIFVSEKSSIKGFLNQATEGIIEIKQFNNKLVELKLDELTDIRLIGLK